MPVPLYSNGDMGGAPALGVYRSTSDGKPVVIPHVDDKGQEKLVTLSASVVEFGGDASIHKSMRAGGGGRHPSLRRPGEPQEAWAISNSILAFGMSPESQARMFKVSKDKLRRRKREAMTG